MYDHRLVPSLRAGHQPYAEPVAAHFCERVGTRGSCDRFDCPYCGSED